MFCIHIYVGLQLYSMSVLRRTCRQYRRRLEEVGWQYEQYTWSISNHRAKCLSSNLLVWRSFSIASKSSNSIVQSSTSFHTRRQLCLAFQSFKAMMYRLNGMYAVTTIDTLGVHSPKLSNIYTRNMSGGTSAGDDEQVDLTIDVSGGNPSLHSPLGCLDGTVDPPVSMDSFLMSPGIRYLDRCGGAADEVVLGAAIQQLLHWTDGRSRQKQLSLYNHSPILYGTDCLHDAVLSVYYAARETELKAASSTAVHAAVQISVVLLRALNHWINFQLSCYHHRQSLQLSLSIQFDVHFRKWRSYVHQHREGRQRLNKIVTAQYYIKSYRQLCHAVFTWMEYTRARQEQQRIVIYSVCKRMLRSWLCRTSVSLKQGLSSRRARLRRRVRRLGLAIHTWRQYMHTHRVLRRCLAYFRKLHSVPACSRCARYFQQWRLYVPMAKHQRTAYFLTVRRRNHLCLKYCVKKWYILWTHRSMQQHWLRRCFRRWRRQPNKVRMHWEAVKIALANLVTGSALIAKPQDVHHQQDGYVVLHSPFQKFVIGAVLAQNSTCMTFGKSCFTRRFFRVWRRLVSSHKLTSALLYQEQQKAALREVHLHKCSDKVNSIRRFNISKHYFCDWKRKYDTFQTQLRKVMFKCLHVSSRFRRWYDLHQNRYMSRQLSIIEPGSAMWTSPKHLRMRALAPSTDKRVRFDTSVTACASFSDYDDIKRHAYSTAATTPKKESTTHSYVFRGGTDDMSIDIDRDVGVPLSSPGFSSASSHALSTPIQRAARPIPHTLDDLPQRRQMNSYAGKYEWKYSIQQRRKR